ncbi:ABC transporter permease [Gluconobacter japonicus]|uniref:ABC transporter permease n=1 Tax=Gluconobacter japonicus TaxID=376620 RepID=A0A9Q2FHC9_GLUJA|nr:ABC transporter permease [Gluconobacter japonicus]MBF0869476.1 ABC transporter permease [Gluconobacter japonicus]
MSESMMMSVGKHSRSKMGWLLRQYVWSVKREIWENRFLFWGPLIMVLLSVILVCIPLLKGHNVSGPGVTPQLFFTLTAELLSCIANLSVLAVGCIYAMGTFYNERKDLSILFWKSLPVSDHLIVLAKIGVILIVVPLFALMITWIGALALVLASTYAFGGSLASLAHSAGIIENLGNYAVYSFLNSLWWLPVYASLFLVSVLVRSTPIVWVLGALAALAITGMAGLPTSGIVNLVSNRFTHFPGSNLSHAKMQMRAGRDQGLTIDHTPVQQLVVHPNFAELFSAPALWWGVLVGVVCLALTIWLRRRAEPI